MAKANLLSNLPKEASEDAKRAASDIEERCSEEEIKLLFQAAEWDNPQDYLSMVDGEDARSAEETVVSLQEIYVSEDLEIVFETMRRISASLESA